MSNILEYDEYNEQEIESLYDDFLNECYPEIKIGCCIWAPSYVLSEMDPIAYSLGFDEWKQSLIEDGLLTDTDA